MTFLIWQGIVRLLLLYFWFLNFSPIIILVVLIIKIGLPPFFRWIWTVSKEWDLKTWVLFLTFHKILPLIILINLLINDFWVLLWPVFSILIFFNFFSLKSLTLISTVRDAAWLVISRWVSMRIFWGFILLYSVIWVITRFYHKFYLNLFLIFLLALPPSVFFLFKILVWMTGPVWITLILRALTLIIFLVYWTYFSNMLFSSYYKVFKKLDWKWYTRILSSHLLLFVLL